VFHYEEALYQVYFFTYAPIKSSVKALKSHPVRFKFTLKNSDLLRFSGLNPFNWSSKPFKQTVLTSRSVKCQETSFSLTAIGRTLC